MQLKEIMYAPQPGSMAQILDEIIETVGKEVILEYLDPSSYKLLKKISQECSNQMAFEKRHRRDGIKLNKG